jgi:SAM-dependent methyltransferase
MSHDSEFPRAIEVNSSIGRCPLCGSTKSIHKESFKSAAIIEAWWRAFQIEASAEFRGVTEFSLLECAECRLQFFEPASLAGSPSLYEKLEKFDWYYMREKWEHRVAMADLDGCENGIEVGCGFGDFVARVGKEKSGIAFEGIEQNPSAVTAARNNGLPVQLMSLSELANTQPGKYAAVCSFQVLEHVPDAGSFLDASCKLLRSGGKLILGLPNAKSFLRHQFNILDMPPHHVTRWNSETLKRMEHWFPLKVRKISYEPLADYHVDAYVEAHTKIVSRFGSRATPWIRSRLSRVVRTLGLPQLLRGQSIYVCYERV